MKRSSALVILGLESTTFISLKNWCPCIEKNYLKNGDDCMKKKNKSGIGKFEPGAVEVPESVLNPKNHKVRITLFLDGDVLMPFKDFAKATGAKYQTLINECLGKHGQSFLKGKIEDVEHQIHQLKRATR